MAPAPAIIVIVITLHPPAIAVIPVIAPDIASAKPVIVIIVIAMNMIDRASMNAPDQQPQQIIIGHPGPRHRNRCDRGTAKNLETRHLMFPS